MCRCSYSFPHGRRPSPRHANVQRTLGRFIGGPFHDGDGQGGPGGWWIFGDTDIRLGPHQIVRPDLAGWHRHRLPESVGEIRPIDIVPDWICEIVSPSNAATDRIIKRRLYAQHGVAFYWIVDPEARTLEAMQLTGDKWLEVGSHGDDDLARIAPFEAIELEVGRLFPPRKQGEPAG